MSAVHLTRRRAASRVTATVRRISPSAAEKLLGKNVHNRNVRQRVVDGYARDMAAGEWHLTGQPIQIDYSGNLIDGQHRLLAVIQSGMTIDFLVVEGLAPESQTVLDSGTKRTAGDQFSLGGERYAALLAATARLTWQWDRGYMHDNTAPTYSEMRTVVDEEPEIKWSVEAGMKLRSLVPASPTVISFCHHICARIDRAAANEFFVEQLANGVEMSPPARALSARLTKAMIAKQRLTKIEQIGYMFRAWNMWREGEMATKLQAPKVTGWLPSNLPSPR